MKRIFKSLWFFLKEISGENEYQKYLSSNSKLNKEEIMSSKEFYMKRLNQKWNKINRCC